VRSSRPNAAPGGRPGTPMRQQRHHRRHHGGWPAQPLERGPGRRAKGAPTPRTAIAPLLVTMDTNGPLPPLSSGGAVLVRAEDAPRVPAVCSPDRGEQPRLCRACRRDPRSASTPAPSRSTGMVPSATSRRCLCSSAAPAWLLRRSTLAITWPGSCQYALLN